MVFRKQKMFFRHGVYFLVIIVIFGTNLCNSSSSSCMADQCKYMKCPPGYKCAINTKCGCTVSCKLRSPDLKRACENYDLSIDCKGNGSIEVVSANYGRTLSGICPGQLDSNTKCFNEAYSLNVVLSKCDGMPSCVISAKNAVFTDPCVGTYKYLEVKYYCSW